LIKYHLTSGKVFEREVEEKSITMAKVNAITEPTYFGDDDRQISINGSFIEATEIVLLSK
jgi:hypothetical protein